VSDKWSLLLGGAVILMGAHEGASGKTDKVLDLDGSFKGDLPYIMIH